MLTQTKEVRDAWRASQRTLDIKVAVNGKTYTATDINSLKYDSGAYTGDTFAIGSTYSNSVQIEFSHLIENLKLGMEVLPSIGIKTSKGYIYEPLGVFIISSEIKMDRNNNLTSISASDRFCGLEGSYKSKLAYPAKVLDVIAEICVQSGVKANVDDLARLPHQADLPSAITGQTYRKALGWIAQLYAGYATFDRKGLFTIRTIAEPNYELDPSQYEQAGLTKNEAPYRISGIQCQTTITTKTRDGEDTDETKNYQVGDTNGSQIKLENNIMTPDRLTNIWEQIKDVNFYPFSLNWFGNPAIEAGDWLKLQDKQGNKFIVPNNSYTLDFNGGLSATSKADQTSSTDSVIAWEGTFSQTIRELQGRKAPDGTVIFPPNVTEPPTNAKPNDVWFKQNGNSTELWVFTEQEDGTGKWIRRDLTPDEIKKQVQEAQDGLKDAKKEIADNRVKTDKDIGELNASIAGQQSTIDDLNFARKEASENLAKADKNIAELNESIGNQDAKIDGLSTSVNTVVIPKVTDITSRVSDVVTEVNEQKNSVTGLQNQSTQQGKDIAKITTDVHSVTVDLANLNGDVNQTKATVQGLQTILGNAQGDIAQIKVDAQKLSTSLSSKVDNLTYANFVSATNSALNAKLVASDLNGYAKTTDVQATANGLQVNINSVADRMNNLKIGAENLLSNTDNLVNYQTNNNGQIQDIAKSNYIPLILNHPELTHMGHVWTDWQSVYSNQEVILEKDKPYWFGFYVCTDKSDGSPFGNISIFGVKRGSDLSHSKVFVGQNTENYSYFGGTSKNWVWHTYKIIGDGEIYSGLRVEGSKSAGGSAYFAGYTLVQSDVAPTGYISSIEDTKHELSQLSAQITANNQRFSSYYTKVETDNKANTVKNDAINTIKNDGNWHGLTNILTNSGFLQTADGFVQKVQQATIPIFDGSGINLVSGTSNVWSDSGWNDFNGSSNQTKVIGKLYLTNLNVGDWITLHLDYQYQNLTGSNLEIIVQGNGNKTGWSYEPFNLPWQKLNASSNLSFGSFNKTFQVTNEMLKNSFFTLQIRIDNAKGGWLQWSNLKIEKGKIATAWSPAPEDYTDLKSQISQTAGTISTMVGRVNNLETKTNVQNINHSIDLNTYTSTGTYFVSASGTNAPANTWFYLDVKRASDGRIVQTWQRDNIPTDRYVRTYIDGHWSNWERSASYSEYSTLNQTVKGLQSTVSNNFTNLKSQISQTAGTIRGEVTDRTNNLQSQITQNANNFNVSLKNATGGVGANLALDTSDVWADGSWTVHKGQFDGTNNQTCIITQVKFKNLQVGDWVTGKIEYQYQGLTGSNLLIKVQGFGNKTIWNGSQFSSETQSLVASKDLHFGEFNFTFQVNDEMLYKNDYYNVQIRIDNAKDGWLQWHNVKFEAGKVATPWCRASEDYATQTSFSELNQTVKGLQSTVSSNYGNLQSQINQSSETISSVIGRVGSLETKTNVQIINHGIDLNSYTSTGTYFVTASGTNAPANTWFYLDVKRASDGRIVQTWQRDNIPTDRYVRTYIDGHWSNWERSASYSEYSTLNQTVKGLQSTVSNNFTNLKSQISQTAGTIRGEVTDRTNNLQSQITQNANNFNITLQNATSGGGLNLARNTSNVWSDGSWNNFNGSSNQTRIITQVYFDGLHVGDWITGFIEYQYQNLSGNNMQILVQGFGNKTIWNGSQFSSDHQNLTASQNVQHGQFKFNFKLTDDMVNWTKNDYYNVQIRVDNAKGGWLQWNKIKFEKGTVATPWSPSPEDKVSKDKILAQINMSAGTTLIQNDKIYMDASSTVFSGKAFIPNAAITNISADKINTGTLDAGRINVINLNANNITTGTINGANLKINLNSGEILFQKGRIGSTNGNLNIDIDSGKMSVTNSTNSGVFFENGELYLSDNWAYGTNSQPKYGVIRRSIHSFTLGECGAEIASPSGISLQTMNYDGAFGAAGFLDQTKNGASVAIDRNGQALINAKQVGLTGGTFFSDNKFIPSKRRPRIVVGTDAATSGLNAWGWGDPLNHVASRIVIDASYVHFPNSYNTTTGSAPNLCIASDGAIVRSTSASKYKTEIKRSYSTEYGEKLLNLPTAIWTDKGQKERYEAGKRRIKPERYFGMIAEDLADAGLDLLVSRNPLTHEIEGIQYERIAPALLPVIKELKDKVNRLEKKVNE